MSHLTEISQYTDEGESAAVTSLETEQNIRSQKLTAALGATVAAVTLAVGFSSLGTHETTVKTPSAPNYNNSTAPDVTTWVSDLPPGTFERHMEAEFFTTGPTEQPTSWNPHTK